MPFRFFSRALTTAAVGGLAAAGLTACGGATRAATSQPAAATDAAPVATSAVAIDNFAFAPAAITIQAGTTVTWTNNDEEPHSVVSSDEPMRSPTLTGKANTFSHTFSRPGRYAYNCGIHPFMHGTVEVTS